jgi:hypothetical protein
MPLLRPGHCQIGQKVCECQQSGSTVWPASIVSPLNALFSPRLDVVTIGAVFHWMDRDAVLIDLDRLVQPGGAIVVVSHGAPGTQQRPPWAETVAEVRTRYLGPERRAGIRDLRHPEERHADVLRRSPFSDIETVVWEHLLERDPDVIAELRHEDGTQVAL